MRLFEVIYEEDGKTIKEPGITQTEIKQVSACFVASSMENLLKHIEYIRIDPEKDLKQIREVVSSVTIIEDAYEPHEPYFNGDQQ